MSIVDGCHSIHRTVNGGDAGQHQTNRSCSSSSLRRGDTQVCWSHSFGLHVVLARYEQALSTRKTGGRVHPQAQTPEQQRERQQIVRTSSFAYRRGSKLEYTTQNQARQSKRYPVPPECTKRQLFPPSPSEPQHPSNLRSQNPALSPSKEVIACASTCDKYEKRARIAS